MNPKVFVIVLTALFGIQGIVNARNIPHNPKNLQQDAVDAIEELKGILQSAIDDAKAQLNELLIDVQHTAQEVIAQGTIDIQAENDKVLSEIEALRQQAAELGQTIEGCIGGQEDAIKQIGLSLVNSLIECVGVQVNEALEIINTTIVDIEATYNIVAELEGQLDACNGGLICIGVVIADCAAAVSSLPLQITEQVVKAQDFISTIKSDMTICATTAVAKTAADAGEILAKIINCVNNQLGAKH